MSNFDSAQREVHTLAQMFQMRDHLNNLILQAGKRLRDAHVQLTDSEAVLVKQEVRDVIIKPDHRGRVYDLIQGDFIKAEQSLA